MHAESNQFLDKRKISIGLH